ncbi:MAG: hypothetical protein BWY99_02256 [Synergistetes bacterium ADurb.BinA166]|nr:MAG: hypothetical protein BWY99_02256 [Synergistetes bacterium ADurb.BinA166]
MGSHVAAGGFTFDKISVGGTWYWTVRATNVQNSSQLYQVADITSPFGKLAAVDVPIPGDVVLEMASTIAQLQEQLAPLLALVGSTPTSYSVTVTEGDPMLSIAAVPFQNAGAFGSFLTAVATPSAPWLSAAPPTVAGLNKNDQGQFTIRVNPATLFASGSPYVGYLNLQDNRNPPTTIPVTVTVTVRPRPSVLVSPASVFLSYSLTGPVSGGAVALSVTNSGPSGSSLTFSVTKVGNISPWMEFVPASGGPLVSGDSAIVTFSIVPAGVPSVPGTYSDSVLVSSPNASNGPVVVPVTLVVSP